MHLGLVRGMSPCWFPVEPQAVTNGVVEGVKGGSVAETQGVVVAGDGSGETQMTIYKVKLKSLRCSRLRRVILPRYLIAPPVSPPPLPSLPFRSTSYRDI